MEEAMTYTGICPFLFFPGSFFPNNCMIRPFQLISVSYHVAQHVAGVMHALTALSPISCHWFQVCPVAFKSAHCHKVSQSIHSPLCLFSCWMMLVSME